jgi:hypothetical protein
LEWCAASFESALGVYLRLPDFENLAVVKRKFSILAKITG